MGCCYEEHDYVGFLFVCLFLKDCERLWNSGQEKQFNAVIRAQKAFLVGAWKTVLLKAKQTKG